VLESNRELVLRRLLECLARDRTKHQVAEVTSLGLVQMTRKRVGSGLLEAFSETCECCNGRGLLIFLDGVDHAGNGHRGRSDGAAAREGKTQRDGQAGKDGRRKRQGKPDKDGPAEDKPADPVATGDDPTAAAARAEASAADSAPASQGAAAEVPGDGAGEQADTGSAQPVGGRRRRRAATREPGPPDMAVKPGQTAPEASAAAGV
jgi:ribonuclease E